MADDDNSSSGGGGGGNDWELVSLTASTYAAAPGPVLPLLDADKRESPPPILMSQHFSLPKEGGIDLLNNTGREGVADRVQDEEPNPASMGADGHYTDLQMSYANISNRDLADDGLISLISSDVPDTQNSASLDGDVLPDGNGLGGLGLPEEEEQATMLFRALGLDTPDARSEIRAHAHRSAGAATGVVFDSAGLSCLAADAPVGSVAIPRVACIPKDRSKIPCQAWWKKTFSFLCSNAKESLTFRCIFVAATFVGLAILGQREKLQLQFDVDSQKISCTMGEPLGQVKGSLIGGNQHLPIAQG